MQIDEKKKNLEKLTKNLLDKMGFKATVYIATTVTSDNNEIYDSTPISVEIQLIDSKYLIGKHGANLSALQHLLRVMARKLTNERINFNVDINGYRENQKQSIVDLAHEIAERALQEKRSILLKPMNAYERRLVHVELADTNGIKTKSVGEGEDRKVVIKPTSIEDEIAL